MHEPPKGSVVRRVKRVVSTPELVHVDELSVPSSVSAPV